MDEEIGEKLAFNSEFFKIPKEKYEKDIEIGLAKEKKGIILDLFANSNFLCSEVEYRKIEFRLHEACKKGDLDLIKIYLSETIEDKTQKLTFKIDKANKTASLFSSHKDSDFLVIPRTVKHESTDYLITSILSIGGKVKTLKFVEDSVVTTIYGHSLANFIVEEIHFPASLNELREGWCNFTSKLNTILISPLNNNFILKNNKYLLAKSDKNSNEFDVLLFASRDIEEISIPSYIRIISSCAFEFCSKLTKIEISPDSNLQTIENYAFSSSKIEEIYFPMSLNKLEKNWCYNTYKMKKIIISPLNDKFIFKDNKYLLGKSNQNNDEFDVFLFLRRDAEEITIPENIKIISPFALEKTKINKIYIPSNVFKIGDSAFFRCVNLTNVEIPVESNLETIEANAFIETGIKQFFIPSKVSKIYDFAFHYCENLQIIEISEESKLQSFSLSIISGCKKLIIMIPPSLKSLFNKNL